MNIEIWSDVVCPWCYIGKRRLESALQQVGGDTEVRWRSFELDPDAPLLGELSLVESLAQKYGTTEQRAESMIDQMTNTARKEGLEFDLKNALPGNTLDAHRLLHFARQQGLQGAMKERLLSAYMTECRPIAERDELAALASDVGLDAGQVGAMLETDRYVDEVRRDESRARRQGVRGVPYFLIDGRIDISGAQPVKVLCDRLRAAQG